MKQMFIQVKKDGSTRLLADTSSPCCGENRSEYVTLNNNLSLKESKGLINKGLAQWLDGAPTCPCCGREL